MRWADRVETSNLRPHAKRVIGGIGGPLAAVTPDGRVLVDDGQVLAGPPGTRRAWWTAGGGLVVETGDTNQLDVPPHDGAVWWLEVDVAEGRSLSAGQDGLIVRADLERSTGRRSHRRPAGDRRLLAVVRMGPFSNSTMSTIVSGRLLIRNGATGGVERMLAPYGRR